MGEEKKGEVSKEENGEEDKKKKDEEIQEVVLRADMHCEACARKVARALKGFQGVDGVTADYRASKVVVKGKTAEPLKLCERIRKKTGKKVEIISPLPKPLEEVKKEPKEEKKKEEPPAVTTIVLKVRMHCEACAQVLQKRIGKVHGVESVSVDIANDHVTVKGVVGADKLVNDVYKKTGKQATIVKDEVKKEDDKKEEDKKDDKPEEKKQEEESKEEDDKKTQVKKNEHWPPPKYNLEYAYAPQLFSDENPNACSVM